MDSDQAAATPVEGVRILGAEEAQAALTGERPAPPPPARAERRDNQLDLSIEEQGEPTRQVGYPDGGPSWSATEAGEVPEVPDLAGEAPSGEVPPLPHWTEPPTGAVPAIFSDDTAEHEIDDDLQAWSSITGSQPRFRNEESDWTEGENAFDLVNSGEHEKLGALSEAGPVDEEAEFAEALAARRPAKARARRQPAAEREAKPRPPRRRPPEAERPAAPPAGRDLPTAVMTALIVVVVALVCFKLGPAVTTVLAAVVVAVATLELCTTLHQRGLRPATPLALLAATFLPIAAYNYGSGSYAIFFALIVVFSMLWFLWQVTPGRATVSVATTVLAFAYVGGLGGFAGLLMTAPHKNGIGLLIGGVICVVAYDVIGYFVGSQWGQQPIAPNVSPNKTVAGTVGGMVASVVAGAIVVSFIGPYDFGSAVVLGILVAFGTCFGDLSESLIKRDLGVKDFGALLPGHGGVLDRFDGLLFCLPIIYYLALFNGKI